MTSISHSQPPRVVVLSVVVAAFVTIASQVLVTRLLSALIFYHFSFLAISLALLGTGAGGLYTALIAPTSDDAGTILQLRTWTMRFAVSLVALPLVAVRLNLEYSELTVRFIVSLLVLCGFIAVPSFAGGVVIAIALRTYTQSVGRLYFFDLVAAALGAVAVVPAIWLLEPPVLLLLLGSIVSVVAVFLSSNSRARQQSIFLVLLTAVLVMASFPTRLVEAPLTGLSDADSLRVDDWTPLSRTIGLVPRNGKGLGVVLYDRVTAPIIGYSRANPSPGWAELQLGPQTIPTAIVPSGPGLIIGGGGGRDIHNLRAAGVTDLDVIELNEGVRKVVDEKLAAFSGSPYSLPGVHTVIGDGRSVLSRRPAKYSQIQISFTDSLSAGGASAYALSENNLYTVEAFKEYLSKLQPGGVLAVTRLRRLVGDESLRTTIIALKAVEELGAQDPTSQVVVVMGTDLFDSEFGTVMVKATPFTNQELATITTLANERGNGVAYAKGSPSQYEWAQLSAAESPAVFCRAYRLNVCPTTDDKPFFFNMKRFGDIGQRMTGYSYSVDPVLILFLTFGILLALSILGYFIPIRRIPKKKKPPRLVLLYFVAIGLGYLIVESVMIQRLVLLLGYPTYSLSVVLSSLLAWTGIGAWWSTRFVNERRALGISLGTATALIASSAWWLPELVSHQITASFVVRVLIAVVVVMPFGLTMGTAMPTGLRRMERIVVESTPFAWAVNGFASVVAAAAATVLALEVGFFVATLAGAGAYFVALVTSQMASWDK